MFSTYIQNRLSLEKEDEIEEKNKKQSNLIKSNGLSEDDNFNRETPVRRWLNDNIDERR